MFIKLGRDKQELHADRMARGPKAHTTQIDRDRPARRVPILGHPNQGRVVFGGLE